ncbi:MAG: hypothetical protein KDJ66_12125, partial [Nitratireductor sp.]|nr:hypothetical protein [Nitratireductor sp.]
QDDFCKRACMNDKVVEKTNLGWITTGCVHRPGYDLVIGAIGHRQETQNSIAGLGLPGVEKIEEQHRKKGEAGKQPEEPAFRQFFKGGEKRAVDLRYGVDEVHVCCLYVAGECQQTFGTAPTAPEEKAI